MSYYQTLRLPLVAAFKTGDNNFLAADESAQQSGRAKEQPSGCAFGESIPFFVGSKLRAGTDRAADRLVRIADMPFLWCIWPFQPVDQKGNHSNHEAGKKEQVKPKFFHKMRIDGGGRQKYKFKGDRQLNQAMFYNIL